MIACNPGTNCGNKTEERGRIITLNGALATLRKEPQMAQLLGEARSHRRHHDHHHHASPFLFPVWSRPSSAFKSLGDFLVLA